MIVAFPNYPECIQTYSKWINIEIALAESTQKNIIAIELWGVHKHRLWSKTLMMKLLSGIQFLLERKLGYFKITH